MVSGLVGEAWPWGRLLMNDYLALGILLILSIISIAALGHGPVLSFDDANYLHYGQQILNGTFNRFESAYSFGYGLSYMTAASLWLTGGSSAPAEIEYIALIFLIYFIAKKVSGSGKISLAVALMALSSAFLSAYTQRILPDMLDGLLVSASIWFMLYDSRKAWLFAGALIGALAFIKLGALSIGFLFLIAILIFRRKQFLPFLIGLLMVAILYFASMDFNLAIIAQYQANQIALNQTSLIANFITLFILLAPTLYISSGPYITQKVYVQVYGLGLFVELALIGAYIAILKKDKQISFWGFIAVIGILYLVFGSESLGTYVPIQVVSRYFEILAGCFAILCAYALRMIYKAIANRYSERSATLVLACIVLMALLFQLPLLWYFHAYNLPFQGAPIA